MHTLSFAYGLVQLLLLSTIFPTSKMKNSIKTHHSIFEASVDNIIPFQFFYFKPFDFNESLVQNFLGHLNLSKWKQGSFSTMDHGLKVRSKIKTFEAFSHTGKHTYICTFIHHSKVPFILQNPNTAIRTFPNWKHQIWLHY